MIAFLLSRTGILAVAAGGFMLLALYAWGLQQANGRLELEAAAAKTREDSLKRDVTASEAAEVRSNEIIRGLSAEAAHLDQKVRDYADELATRPAGGCALSERDVERLLSIGR